VGAFIPVGRICETLFATPFTTPFLHIYGEYDVVVLEERTRRVIDLNNSSSKRVESHIGGMSRRIDITPWSVLRLTLPFAGHFVPNSQRWKQFFIDYIKAGFANPGRVLSPSASSESLDAVFAGSGMMSAVTPY